MVLIRSPVNHKGVHVRQNVLSYYIIISTMAMGVIDMEKKYEGFRIFDGYRIQAFPKPDPNRIPRSGSY